MDGEERTAPARSPWIRRLKFAGGLLAISIGWLAFVIFVENWRGKQDWAAYQEKLLENNQSINGLGIPPQTIPDDENFAMTPLLAPLVDQIVDPVSLRVKLRDNTAVARIQKKFPSYRQLNYPQDAPHDYWCKKTNIS